jgi:hypothetical protein
MVHHATSSSSVAPITPFGLGGAHRQKSVTELIHAVWQREDWFSVVPLHMLYPTCPFSVVSGRFPGVYVAVYWAEPSFAKVKRRAEVAIGDNIVLVDSWLLGKEQLVKKREEKTN